MKKILFILIVLFIQIKAFAQTTGYFSIKDSTTAFGTTLPSGRLVFDVANNNIWKLTATASATTTIQTASKILQNQYFNGKRTVKRSGLPAVNVNTTTVADFLNAYFFPFIPATISINGNVLQEIGTSASVTISGATTVNDETVFSLGKVNQTYPLPASTIYSFGSATSYSTSVTFYPKQSDATSLELRYQAQQTTGNNGSPTIIYSGTKYLQSVYPFLWGVSASDLEGGGTAPYTTLTKSVTAKSNKSVSLTGTNGYIYFCYPASYGNLTSILDQNGFQQITSFTKYTANVTSTGLGEDYTVSYYIYKLNNTTSPSAWTYTFSF